MLAWGDYMQRFFDASVGDQVMICPEYWSRSGNGAHFSEPYKSNGPDHIYTVTKVEGGYFKMSGHLVLFLDGHGGWDNDYEFLWPVVQFGQEEDIAASEDLSVLFD